MVDLTFIVNVCDFSPTLKTYDSKYFSKDVLSL